MTVRDGQVAALISCPPKPLTGETAVFNRSRTNRWR